jgi:phospholipase/lecithinase/hemolysin
VLSLLLFQNSTLDHQYEENMQRKFILGLVVVTFLITACSNSTDSNNKSLEFNGLDFSRTVFLGNSLTAGYADGGLVEDLQAKGWAQQLMAHFEQPINYPQINNPGIGSVVDDQIAGVLTLVDLTPTIEPRGYTPLSQLNSLIQNPGESYNNVAVPGALIGEALTVTSMATSWQGDNAFYDVVLQGSGKTMLRAALDYNPTFAFVWLGNNDVLGYATSGGTAPLDPGAAQGLGFTNAFTAIMDSLTANGLRDQMLVLNLPAVTSIPYFLTILPLQDDGQGGTVRLVGSDDVDGTRAISDNELICLTASSFLASNPGEALPDQYWLTSTEMSTVDAKIAEFNGFIAANAASYGYKVVDSNSLLKDIAENGYVEGRVQYSINFISGGLFSLDGVHPSEVGYRLVANYIIDVLNSDYGTNISQIAP